MTRLALGSALWIVIMSGLLATAQVSQFLQTYLNEILGPVLIGLGHVYDVL